LNTNQEQLFPVTLYRSRLEDASFFNVYLKSRLYSWRQRERSGIEISADTSMGSWHSKSTMHEMQEFHLFFQQIRQCIDEVLKQEALNGEFRSWCVCMAAHICDRYGYDQPLEEISNGWCGIYFVQTPAESGGITFFNPSLAKEVDDLDYMVRDKTYVVEAGEIYIFPSWLRYEIQPNQSNSRGEAGERVSISFAFNLQKGDSQ